MAVIIFLSLLVALPCLLVFMPKSFRVDWFTPAEIYQNNQTGIVAKGKNLLRGIAGPLLQWYRNRKPFVQVDSCFFLLTPDAASTNGLGPPTATNVDGLRAWVVDSRQLAGFKARFKLGGPSNLSTAGMVFSNGIYVLPSPQIKLHAGDTSYLGGGGPVPQAEPYIGAIAFNATVHARTSGRLLNLRIVANGSELDSPSILAHIQQITNAATPPVPTLSKTNFIACQSLIPNGGGLILQTGDWAMSGKTNYWILLQTTLVDSNGVPLKR